MSFLNFQILVVMKMRIYLNKVYFFICIMLLLSACQYKQTITEITTTTQTCMKEDVYDYSKTVEESKDYGDEYLKRSLFVGDSRIYVIEEAQLDYTNVVAKVGLIVNKLDVTIIKQDEQQDYTAMDLIRQQDIDHLYIMFGYNELGWVYPDLFIQAYQRTIEEIKKIHPHIDVYVLSIYMPSEEALKKDKYASKEKIEEYNQLLHQMCIDNKYYFIQSDTFFANEQGYIKEEYTEDGVHLKQEYILDYLMFIKTHVVEREQYEKIHCD
ncbi:hypothetical protein EII25_02945 [Erysipelotrichaceae bacterium OH741_COT-311]|nr:hypothetical protein EII25_02945 [Erysipelotrichaceae bacterium OH741_COT-311]